MDKCNSNSARRSSIQNDQCVEDSNKKPRSVIFSSLPRPSLLKKADVRLEMQAQREAFFRDTGGLSTTSEDFFDRQREMMRNRREKLLGDSWSIERTRDNVSDMSSASKNDIKSQTRATSKLRTRIDPSLVFGSSVLTGDAFKKKVAAERDAFFSRKHSFPEMVNIRDLNGKVGRENYSQMVVHHRSSYSDCPGPSVTKPNVPAPPQAKNGKLEGKKERPPLVVKGCVAPLGAKKETHKSSFDRNTMPKAEHTDLMARFWNWSRTFDELYGIEETGNFFDDDLFLKNLGGSVRECKYTCHQNCTPRVSLECSSFTPGDDPLLTSIKSAIKKSNAKTNEVPVAQDGRTPDKTVTLTNRKLVPTATPNKFFTLGHDGAVELKRDRSVEECADSQSPGKQPSVARSADSSTGVQLRDDKSTDHASNSQSLPPSTDSPAANDSPKQRRNSESDETTTMQGLLIESGGFAALIETYNKLNNGVYPSISMNADGQFSANLKVHLCLSRPINVVHGVESVDIPEGSSVYDSTSDSSLGRGHTSFFLPRDTPSVVYSSSEDTTDDVISVLLNKYLITDNPRKFAMFQEIKCAVTNKITLRRMSTDERPLLVLLTNTDESLRLILQENETDVIQWDLFTVAELASILRVFERDEASCRQKVTSAYQRYSVHLEAALRESQTVGATSEA